jgi:hypothetical protein
MRGVKKSEKIILLVFSIAIILLIPLVILDIVKSHNIMSQLPVIGSIVFIIMYLLNLIYRRRKK